MKFIIPPSGLKYKLLGTRHTDSEITLVVMEYGQGIKEISLNDIDLQGEDFIDYIISLKDNIERGMYNLELLQDELSDIKEC